MRDLTPYRSGLGLLEYLYWCEDLEAEPIMGVWAGYALGGTSVPENQLDPYIQEAIDQINFAIGDPATSSAAALRASLGRPQPFKLLYIEIGNEVGLSWLVKHWLLLTPRYSIGLDCGCKLCIPMEAVCNQVEARVPSAEYIQSLALSV